jgi:general secretion pathway protein G
MKLQNDQKGFSLAELLIVVAIMGILATIVIMNVGGSETGAKESQLKSNLKGLRDAVGQYKTDHGFYPATPEDKNSAGDAQYFVRQLTWYTNTKGAVSKNRTTEYRFGPYLSEFPINPFYEGSDPAIGKKVSMDIVNQRILEELRKSVAAASGNNGWYYEAKSGLVVPNLGGDTFPDDYCYY